MPNPYFKFKQFTVFHDRCAMKVTTDSCLFGAWAAEQIQALACGRAGSKVKSQNLLDIGAGTGLLSLMIAQKNDLEIEAVEIDEEAAMQARENVLSSPWDERIEVHHDNILLFRSDQKFDVVISNPPFYENELQSGKTEKNIAHHSEELLISQVVQLIAQHLSEDGIFFLLYPFKRHEEIKNLLQDNKLHPQQWVILKQSVKHQPFRIMMTGTKSEKESGPSEITMSVRDENQEYTEAFVRLLKDYYLYL